MERWAGKSEEENSPATSGRADFEDAQALVERLLDTALD